MDSGGSQHILGVSTAETGRWAPAGKRVGVEQETKEAVELSAAAVHCLLLHLAGQQGRADVPRSACTRVVRLEAEENDSSRLHSFGNTRVFGNARLLSGIDTFCPFTPFCKLSAAPCPVRRSIFTRCVFETKYIGFRGETSFYISLALPS